MVRSQHNSSEWFEEASRCYIENHQGCPWCGGSYRVFQVRRGPTTEFFCNACDFRAGFDESLDRYYSIPGMEPIGDVPETMHQSAR